MNMIGEEHLQSGKDGRHTLVQTSFKKQSEIKKTGCLRQVYEITFWQK